MTDTDTTSFDVPDNLFRFMKAVVDGGRYVHKDGSVRKMPGIDEKKITVKDAIPKSATPDEMEIVGVVTSYEIKPIPGSAFRNATAPIRSQLSNKTFCIFKISDPNGGHYLNCCFHNASSAITQQVMPGGVNTGQFEDIFGTIMKVRDSALDIKVRGEFKNIGGKRYFVVNNMDIVSDRLESKLTDTQMMEFLQMCDQYDIDVVELMKSTIFRKFVADDYLKTSMLLWSLTPKDPNEMIHMGIISAQGQGKDYLVDRIMSRVAPHGKMEGKAGSKVAAMIGAMDSNDLNSVGIGVFTRHNFGRVVVSEIQLWDEEMMGVLLGVLGNGKAEINKGKVIDLSRDACTNVLMLGNPPQSWKKGKDPRDMLRCFGRYTYQMVSRLSLIFSKLTLTDKMKGASKLDRLIKNIEEDSLMQTHYFNELPEHIQDQRIKEAKASGQYKVVERSRVYELFFREYLKKVSMLNVHVYDYVDIIKAELIKMGQMPEFQNFLITRGEIDNRKMTQFVNIIKSFAKLKCRSCVKYDDIKDARRILMESVKTMNKEFDMALFGSDYMTLDIDILHYLYENKTAVSTSIRKACNISDDKFDDEWNERIQFLMQEHVIDLVDNKYIIKTSNLPQFLYKYIGIDKSEAQRLTVDEDKKINKNPGVMKVLENINRSPDGDA